MSQKTLPPHGGHVLPGHLLKDLGVEGKRLRWQAIQHAMLNGWAYRTSAEQKQR